MIELLKHKTFMLSDSHKQNREIKFGNPFSDEEFNDWRIKRENGKDVLLLRNNGETVVQLSYDGETLAGRDLRGGKASMRPLPKMQAAFDAYFKNMGKVKLGIPKSFQTIQVTEKVEDVAVLSHNIYDGVDCYPIIENLGAAIDKLFYAGYNSVMYVDKPLDQASVELLNNLSKSQGNVGCVQVVSNKKGAADTISLETGAMSCFAITKEVWSKVRKQTLNPQFNFETGFRKALKSFELNTYSMDMSRDRQTTPQDSRRKNFKCL